jgi:hypothetical protein
LGTPRISAEWINTRPSQNALAASIENARVRIHAGQVGVPLLITLVISVARGAGQHEVVYVIGSTVGLRKDVIEMRCLQIATQR